MPTLGVLPYSFQFLTSPTHPLWAWHWLSDYVIPQTWLGPRENESLNYLTRIHICLFNLRPSMHEK